jgi:hypothetical protein
MHVFGQGLLAEHTANEEVPSAHAYSTLCHSWISMVILNSSPSVLLSEFVVLHNRLVTAIFALACSILQIDLIPDN